MEQAERLRLLEPDWAIAQVKFFQGAFKKSTA
jgi:hypothetical protein